MVVPVASLHALTHAQVSMWLLSVFLVVVGLNAVDPAAYDGKWKGRLLGAEDDARAFLRLCRTIHSGSEVREYVLIGKDADRAGFRAALDDIAKRAAAEDLILIYFAGHGARSISTHDRQDIQDEDICLRDGLWIDDEFAAVWMQMPRGAEVVLITDSCHSTGASYVAAIAAGFASPAQRDSSQAASWLDRLTGLWRGVVLRFSRLRSASDDIVEKTLAIHGPKYDALLRPIHERWSSWPPPFPCTVVQFAACDSHQVALEVIRGIFTNKIVGAFARKKGQITYDELLKAARNRMPVEQDPKLRVVSNVTNFDQVHRLAFRR